MATFNTTSASSTITAAAMVQLLMQALASSPATVLEVVVDGQTVSYQRATAIKELQFWQREAAKEAGTRPRVAQVDLSGF